MSRPTIVGFRQFYSSQLGRKVKQRLRGLVLGLWPKHSAQAIVGVGYAVPVLRVLEREKPSAIVALMPADQGAIYWPVHFENRSILADELVPPFAPNTLHRIVMLHAFEYVAKPLDLLKTYWQILMPGGQILLIVPNRRGLWASFSNTPFARGTPYSLTQVKELLNEAEFTVREMQSALFAPPSPHPFWLRSWGVVETLGRLLIPMLGGVLIVEAEKQIYAGIAQPLNVAAGRKWLPTPAASTAPAKSF